MIDKVNGPAAAALLAGGIGSAAMGLVTLFYEINDKSAFAKSMTWNKGVGGLSGKSMWAIIIFFVSWAVLHYIWKDKETDFARISSIAGIDVMSKIVMVMAHVSATPVAFTLSFPFVLTG